MSLTVARVRPLWEARPVERVYHLGSLTDGQRYTLFPPHCACGENHRKSAANLMRCLRLHPEVLLRADEVDMSLRMLIKLSAVCGDAEATVEHQLQRLQMLVFGGQSVAEDSVDAGPAVELAA